MSREREPANVVTFDRQPRLILLVAGLIAAAVGAAYLRTFDVPFIFDDVASIVDNPTIRHVWPLRDVLSPPAQGGYTVSGRPILNLSLALNYAISGLNVWSYHAVNLLIHVLAGLTLFGITRRTLARPPLAAQFENKALVLAAIISALWSLHPLQTESVTYVVQRAESLMGLFFFLTLYAFVRSAESLHPWRWWVASWSACLLGVGTKEVAALAPLLVLLYDRTFVSGTFRSAWRRHRVLYLALAATWLPLAWLIASVGGNRGGTMGFGLGASWATYAATQFEAVTRYGWLALWPHPLVFEYGKISPAPAPAILFWAAPLLALGSGTLIALWRWPILGFLGMWFFCLLAPTSLVPGNQMIVEHRMYLPLAAVVVLGVALPGKQIGGRGLMGLGLGLSTLAGVGTYHRNALYRNEQALWEDTLRKRPTNARAHNNLGSVLYQRGRFEEATAQYRESIRLDPTTAQPHYNLGLVFLARDQLAEAAASFAEAVRILPHHFDAQLNLGIVLVKLGRPQEALPHFAEAVRYSPSPAQAHLQFGVALANLGRWNEAMEHDAAALQLDPTYAEAHNNWGIALFRTNAFSAAIEHFQAALRLKPQWADAHFNLGLVEAAAGHLPEAIEHYSETVRLDPRHGEAELNLGVAFGQINRMTEAVAHLERAVQLRPNDARVHYNTGYALLLSGRRSEARAHFENAVRLEPGFAAAEEMLRRLPPLERQP